VNLGDPTRFILDVLYLVPALVLGLTAHELAHAGVAVARGDQTPRIDGRLSINPSHHLDPWGTLAVFFIHFGWARPLRLNPYRMRSVFDPILVWLAGPVASLLIAVALSLPLKWMIAAPVVGIGSPVFEVLLTAFYFNVLLAVLNLIPIPGLDGYNVLAALLRRRFSRLFFRVDSSRQVIIGVVVLLVVFIPGLLNYAYDPVSTLLLGDVIRPVS
jgi:Zn-dependent protease